ncbi:MAG: hypothetical protein ACOY3Z_03840 [Thermodesulfobacteriota bacterium]
MLEIHQTRRFAKRLAAMAKEGKNERVVAVRARKIIADLQAHPLHEEAECKRTRHGELRLDDCRKYDLSCGFRLIALKRENRLIFSWIGTHDDCQRWIENNRYCLEEIDSAPVPAEEAIGPSQPETDDAMLPEPDEYETLLMAKIDQGILREIFAGLFPKVRRAPGNPEDRAGG